MNKEDFFNEFIKFLNGFVKSPIHENLNETGKGEVAILIYLSTHQGVTAGELMEALHVGSGRIANALNSLERKEYIKREKKTDDKRKTFVILTESGKAFVNGKKQELNDKIRMIFDILGPEDSKNLLQIMEKFENARRKS